MLNIDVVEAKIKEKRKRIAEIEARERRNRELLESLSVDEMKELICSNCPDYSLCHSWIFVAKENTQINREAKRLCYEWICKWLAQEATHNNGEFKENKQ